MALPLHPTGGLLAVSSPPVLSPSETNFWLCPSVIKLMLYCLLSHAFISNYKSKKKQIETITDIVGRQLHVVNPAD